MFHIYGSCLVTSQTAPQYSKVRVASEGEWIKSIQSVWIFGVHTRSWGYMPCVPRTPILSPAPGLVPLNSRIILPVSLPSHGTHHMIGLVTTLGVLEKSPPSPPLPETSQWLRDNWRCIDRSVSTRPLALISGRHLRWKTPTRSLSDYSNCLTYFKISTIQDI